VIGGDTGGDDGGLDGWEEEPTTSNTMPCCCTLPIILLAGLALFVAKE
jgi:hypothetical protein